MTDRHETMARKLCELRGLDPDDSFRMNISGEPVTRLGTAKREMIEFDMKMKAWQAAQGEEKE